MNQFQSVGEEEINDRMSSNQDPGRAKKSYEARPGKKILKTIHKHLYMVGSVSMSFFLVGLFSRQIRESAVCTLQNTLSWLGFVVKSFLSC